MPSLRRTAPLLALAAQAASAAPAGATIVPQDNIAGVKIGMTQERVLDLLGDPTRTVTRLGGGGGEIPITTYTYKRPGLKVLFRPNRANTANIVFVVKVYRGRGQRTAEGIGIGSTRAAVRRKVAGVRCERFDPSYAICLVGTGRWGRISTSFELNRRNRVKSVSLVKPIDA
jgi:hypothetical protein